MVALVRRLSGVRRVGHGGTLDPFASGVLPIFIGKATRLVEFHLGATKRYRATVCFGASSTTDDLEGELTPVSADAPAPTRDAVVATLDRFRGEITQRPPAYSALKVAGRRAYAMARAGETVDLAPRTITVHELDLVDWDGTDPARPIATIDVVCSAGTYVRALARDLGAAVGNAAYLGALVRTASGDFRLEDAVSIDVAREAAAAPDRFGALLLPLDAGLPPIPEVRLGAAEREAVLKGQFVRPATGLPEGLPQESLVRLVDQEGGLVALGRVRGSRVAPDKVLVEVTDAPKRVGLARLSADGVAARRASMRVVRGLDALQTDDGPLFAVVGVFDGLHRGHQYLLHRLRVEADRRKAKAAVITFDAHPDEIITGAAPPILCDPEERLARLETAGVDVTVVQPFDRALRMTPYQAFIDMISSRTKLAGLLMTPDAAFGHERRGTPEALAALGRERGWDVVVVAPFQIAGRDIRSADIRALIAAGDLVGAAALLGRPYAVVGEAGERTDRGSSITFRLPVALPPPGRYDVTVEAAAGGGVASGDAVLGIGPAGAVLDGAMDLQPGSRVRLVVRG